MGWGSASPRTDGHRSPSAAAGSTGSSGAASATSAAGTERGSALPCPGHPCPAAPAAPAARGASGVQVFGRGSDIWGMRQRGEMRVPLPGCITVALDGMQWDGRDGTGWNGMGWLWAGCGVMVSTGAKAPAFFRCSPSCPALKRSQQEGRELGKLYLSPASSEGLGSTGRNILGWYCQEAQSSVGPAVAAILLTQGLPPGRCLSQPTGSSGDDASALWQRGNAQASRCIRRPGSDTSGKAPRDTSVPSVPGSESPRVRAWHPGHPPRSPCAERGKGESGRSPGRVPDVQVGWERPSVCEL